MAGAEERPKEESRGSGESKLSLVLREPREIERGVAEQLVEMFRKQPKTEWSKLVGYSAEWTEVRIYTRGIDFCSANAPSVPVRSNVCHACLSDATRRFRRAFSSTCRR